MKKVFAMSIHLDYDVQDLREAGDEEFKELCRTESGGRVVELEDFDEMFNDFSIEPSMDYIRILED